MSNRKLAEEIPADEQLQVDVSNEIERTPTDKPGDETQRNEQSSTRDGVEGQSRRDRHKRPLGDGSDASSV